MTQVENRHRTSVLHELHNPSQRQQRYQRRVNVAVYPGMRIPLPDDELCANPICNRRILRLYATLSATHAAHTTQQSENKSITPPLYESGLHYCGTDCRDNDMQRRDQHLCKYCAVFETEKPSRLPCTHTTLCTNCRETGTTCPSCNRQAKTPSPTPSRVTAMPYMPTPLLTPPSPTPMFVPIVPIVSIVSIQQQYEIYRQHALQIARQWSPKPSTTSTNTTKMPAHDSLRSTC